MFGSVPIVRYRHKKSDTKRTTQLVHCFQNVFAEPPWNEWMKCPVCGARWGIQQRPELECLNFEHCGTKVVEYWPETRVREDLDHEITPNASCWLALMKGSVVGFCWGYKVTSEYLEDRLQVPLIEEIEKSFGKGHRIAYQDELGVENEYRGKKIAKKLFIRRHKDFLRQRLTLGIVRTRREPEPSVTYLWFTQKFGYKIVAEYPKDDGRVVLAQTLQEVGKRM